MLEAEPTWSLGLPGHRSWRRRPRRTCTEVRKELDLAQIRVTGSFPRRPWNLTSCPSCLAAFWVARKPRPSFADQLALLESWKSARHQALFPLLRNDPAINTLRLGEAALHNNYYPTPDAEIYAAMILDRKPRCIVEVGSGFSTLIARAAVNFCGHDTRIVVIDPCPRTDVHAAADEVILSPAETSGLTGFTWANDDLLFIDSSHICRVRGDLPCLFCRVVPGPAPRHDRSCARRVPAL